MSVFIFLVVMLMVYPVLCSLGDMDPQFRQCVKSCRDNDCPSSKTDLSSSLGYSSKKLVAWDCYEVCSYDCMTEITKYRVSSGYSVLKYYGHWPFNRLFGLEEPASVLFSALNFIPHLVFLIRCAFSSNKNQNTAKYYMTYSIIVYALCACNAWIASTLFHSKKTEFATQYDYISALIFLCSGLWVSIRRFIGSTASPMLMWSMSALGAAVCAHRVLQMIQGRVSFDSHMHVCIGIVIVTTIVWVLWCLMLLFSDPITSKSSKPIKSRNHKWVCLGCQLWLIAASALEIFDFPPYFELFDAHSLWHASTVPLGFIWYDWFWKQDYKEFCESQQ